MFGASREFRSWFLWRHNAVRTLQRAFNGTAPRPETSAAGSASISSILQRLLLEDPLSGRGFSQVEYDTFASEESHKLFEQQSLPELQAFLASRRNQKEGYYLRNKVDDVGVHNLLFSDIGVSPSGRNIAFQRKSLGTKKNVEWELDNLFPFDLPILNEDFGDNFEGLRSEEFAFDPQIPFLLGLNDDYEILRCVGYGAHGCVFEVRNKWDKMLYAIKAVFFDKDSELQTCREVQALAQLNGYPNIVQYYTSWVVDNGTKSGFSVYSISGSTESTSSDGEEPLALQARAYDGGRTLLIKMELCTVKNVGCVTLRAWLNRSRCRNALKNNISILHDVCAAIEQVHKKGYLHRDIKPENILLYTDAEGKLRAKLSDFGLVSIGDDNACSASTVGKHKHLIELTSGLGTFLYSAPEQLSSTSYDNSCDIFSLGVLMYEVLRQPFETGMERAKVISGIRDGILEDADLCEDSSMNAHLMALVASCVALEPSMRPTVAEVNNALFSLKLTL